MLLRKPNLTLHIFMIIQSSLFLLKPGLRNPCNWSSCVFITSQDPRILLQIEHSMLVTFAQWKQSPIMNLKITWTFIGKKPNPNPTSIPWRSHIPVLIMMKILSQNWIMNDISQLSMSWSLLIVVTATIANTIWRVTSPYSPIQIPKIQSQIPISNPNSNLQSQSPLLIPIPIPNLNPYPQSKSSILIPNTNPQS